MIEPRIAVVIVTWNSALVLPGLLDSMGQGVTGTTAQVIIVDNDSADGTLELARKTDPSLLVLSTGRNAGFAAGINAGLAAADPFDAVLILNADVRLTPGCVATMYRSLGNGVGIVAPLNRNANGDVDHSLRREATIARALGLAVLGQRSGRWKRFGEEIIDDDIYTRPIDVDWASGAALMISAECARVCGPWQDRSSSTPRRRNTSCVRATADFAPATSRMPRSSTSAASRPYRQSSGVC